MRSLRRKLKQLKSKTQDKQVQSDIKQLSEMTKTKKTLGAWEVAELKKTLTPQMEKLQNAIVGHKADEAKTCLQSMQLIVSEALLPTEQG